MFGHEFLEEVAQTGEHSDCSDADQWLVAAYNITRANRSPESALPYQMPPIADYACEKGTILHRACEPRILL